MVYLRKVLLFSEWIVKIIGDEKNTALKINVKAEKRRDENVTQTLSCKTRHGVVL